MPEFHIDLGLDFDRWNALDKFTRAYVEAMFWTDANSDNEELEDATFADLANESLAKIKADCTDFNLTAGGWLHKAYLRGDMSYDMERAGVDFWLTRNRHGAGFWDRGLGVAGDKLTEIAHGYGEMDLYRGDDGKVYVT